MSLLTDDEFIALWVPHYSDPHANYKDFARAIESAILAKLAAGVNVEPVAYSFELASCIDANRMYSDWRAVLTNTPACRSRTNLIDGESFKDFYTIDQLQTAIAAARFADQREIEALKARVEHDFQRWQEAIANYDFERSLNEKLMDGSAKLTNANAKLRWVIESMKQEAETGRVIGDEIGMRDALEEISRQGLAAQNAMKETP